MWSPPSSGIGFAPKAIQFPSPPEIGFPPPAMQFSASPEIGFPPLVIQFPSQPEIPSPPPVMELSRSSRIWNVHHQLQCGFSTTCDASFLPLVLRSSCVADFPITCVAIFLNNCNAVFIATYGVVFSRNKENTSANKQSTTQVEGTT